MMTDAEYIFNFIIKPARVVLDEVWADPNPEAADIQLLATAQQESSCCNRHQRLASGAKGSARSLWQIEGPTCSSVLERWAPLARCLQRVWIPPADSLATGHPWLAWHDAGAWWTARGILALDPAALPEPGDGAAAWECYLKNWRPGKPRPDDWNESYDIAMRTYYYGATWPSY
jgi:hypothetical protein